MRLLTVLALMALVMMPAMPAAAGDSAPILRITGQIAESVAEFDLETLRALPAVSIETSTVVTDGKHHFKGFLIRDLLDHVQAEGTHVTATALNDYMVDIPISDFQDYNVIAAYEMDGEPLHRADKGPLWIIYPRDDHRALQDIRYDYRWVWQLSGLKVQ